MELLREQKSLLPVFPAAVGDGRQGYPEEAPYDAIHVGAAAAAVPKEVRAAVLVSAAAGCLPLQLRKEEPLGNR